MRQDQVPTMTRRAPSTAAPSPDPTRRFSDRVEDYIRYRPGYPAAVLETLQREAGLTPAAVVADLGSGTGISSELFLRFGCRVYGVEPNREMRQAAERLLAPYPGFESVQGTAEATTLPAASVDVVAAAQAFHWFDRRGARREAGRILQPGGWAVILWNCRLTDSTPFAAAYERLLLRYATDYREVNHRNLEAAELEELFDGGGYETRHFPNRQVFDFDGVRGRLLSSSYAPAPGQPGHEAMLAELSEIFAAHHEDGRVRFDYTTEMHFGHLGS